jgi:choline-sulfatase
MKTNRAMLFAVLLMLCIPVATEAKEKPPNILFIHVDQMHWQAMSAYGNPHVRTPAMDRMAADGCSFRASYATMPQCCPARASWYTGRMSSEHGVPVNGCPILPELPDLGTWLAKHGDYESVYAGKWHVSGRDVTKSFRVIYGSGKGEYADGAIARACMGFLENYQGDKPFFLNAGFMNPHDCCYTAGAAGGQGKFRFAKQIEGKLPPLPKNFIAKPSVRTKGWKELEWRYYIYIYYRWVEMVDAEIGRLYDALMSSRFADKTAVVFAADHGDGLGFHGNVSKGYMEEEAWRVPVIVIRPGRDAKGKQDAEHLSIGVDIAATICDYAQVPMLPGMTIGKSLRPLAEGKKVDQWREYIVGESFLGDGRVGVRDGKHKTIFACDGPVKVFDLQADPLEMNDLFASAEGEAVAEKHMKCLREYLSRIELCPSRGPKELQRPYRVYQDWYRKVKEEASQ